VPGHLEVARDAVSFVAPPLRIDVTRYAFAVAPADRQAAALGVRPEHVTLDPVAAVAGSAIVKLVEPMGPTQVVWLDVGERPFAAHVDSAVVARAGQSVRFAIDASRASLFDAGSEQRL